MNGEGDALHQIIDEVAVKHGFALDRNDPVLMIYTINRHLMQSSATIQQAMLDRYRQELDDSMRKWEIQAARQQDSTLQKIIDSTKENIANTIRTEMDVARNQLEADYQRRSRDVSLTLLGSALTLIAAAIVLWATMTS
ncbi:MAG: hypothetical protein ABJA60_00685 [Nitrosospira sp.]